MYACYIVQGLDHTIGIFVGHRRIDRKRNRSLKFPFCMGEFTDRIAETPLVKGMQVQRDEVDGCPDSTKPQLFDHAIPVDAQLGGIHAEDVQVPGVRNILGSLGSLECGERFERSSVTLRERCPASAHGITFCKLHES